MNNTFLSRRAMLSNMTVSMFAALKAEPAQAAPPKPWVDLQGHRGAAGLLPENTIPSFAKAVEIGVHTLEPDVVMTKDDVMVISHDPDLNPDITRGPDGNFLDRRGPRIIDLTYEQLQQYQVGALRPNSRYGSRFPEQVAIEQLRIPKLSDLFDWVRKQASEHIRFAIETKISPLRPSYTASPEHVVGHLLDLIRQHRLEQRVQVLSFDWRSLQLIQRQSPGMETVYLSTAYPSINNIDPGGGGDSKWTAGFQRRHFASIPHMIKAAGGSHWSCSYPHLDQSQIDIAHQLGLKVLAWTVDDTTHMTHMLDMGIDGLVTNRPDRAIQSLKARGQYRTPGAA